MEKKGYIHLTNEKLAGKFISSFDLVNYAIRLAENMIHTGRDSRVKSDVQNRAMLILEEIYEGKDQFDDIKAIGSSAESESSVSINASTRFSRSVVDEKVEKRKHSSVGANFREE